MCTGEASRAEETNPSWAVKGLNELDTLTPKTTDLNECNFLIRNLYLYVNRVLSCSWLYYFIFFVAETLLST